MKAIRSFVACISALFISSCGYHLGGVKPADMQGMNTFAVEMFENTTVQPNVGMLMTTAMTNTLQSDGTYSLSPREDADFIVKGTVTHIDRSSLITDTEDTYVSREIGLTVHVKYQVVERATGKVLCQGGASGSGSYYNQGVNTVSAMDTALSYATRLVAEDITLNMTAI